MIVFDLETGPLPLEQLKATMPAFDEAEVKCGNLKDPEKIAAKIAEAKASYEDDYVSKAALSPLTGRILACGYCSTDTGKTVIDGGEEPTIVTAFWQRYERCRQQGRVMVGHNIEQFDVRFLMRRSWLLGLDVPGTVLDRGKWLDAKTFVDTMVLWGGPVKLDVLARAFGVGAKTDGVDGSMFAELWAKDRAKAEEYLKNDLEITRKVAERMGLI